MNFLENLELTNRAKEWLKDHPEIDEKAYKMIYFATMLKIQAVGESLEDEGFIDTPHRVAKMHLNETLTGYQYNHQGLVDIARSASFKDPKKGNIVLVKDVQFFSNCSHHLVPFFGKVHVAYIPGDNVLGLSKIPRVVQAAAKRYQLQEQLGQQIADAIAEASGAQQVAVIIDSDMHLCVSSRGVNDYSSNTTTIATAGQKQGWTVDQGEFIDTVFKMLGR